MSVSLADLAKDGKFKAQKTSKSEISRLLVIFERDMADAQITNLSTDRCFTTAYNAALMVSIAALAASGYRASNEGHHYWTIQSLAFTLGIDTKMIDIFNRFRQKRNISDYERTGLISKTEASEIIELAARLRIVLEEWLRINHPDLI
jgi:uncharacterized protein (UPF0332 family)